jgi:hypothetical protein
LVSLAASLVTATDEPPDTALTHTRCLTLALYAGTHARTHARTKVEHAIIIVAEFEPPEGFYPDNGNEVEATVAVELALTGVREPQRFEFATLAKVSSRKGKLAALHRHAMAGWVCLRAITMQLQAIEEPGRVVYSVASVSQQVIEKPSYMAKLAKLASKAKRGAGGLAVDGGGGGAVGGGERVSGAGGGEDGEDDDVIGEEDLGVDESHHVLSGMGKVTREMTENAIEAWSNLLVKWDSVTDAKRRAMARKGVPDALRHQVWKRLLGEGLADNDLIDAFPHLCSQKSDEDMDAAVRQQIT